MFRFFIVLTLCFLPLMLSSQVIIEGYVFDIKTREPISNAFVGTDLGISTVSGDDGFYHIFIDKNVVKKLKFVLVVESPGYKDFKKSVYLSNLDTLIKLNILLHPLEYWLDTVEVGAIRNIVSSSTGFGLDLKDIDNVPILIEKDVLQSLRFIPGIIRKADLMADFSIRGADPKNNLILIDDIPILNPFHLGGITGIVNSDIIDDVMIFPGAYPPVYSGTTSGIMYIRTRPSSTRFKFKGSIGLLSSDFYIDVPIRGGGFILSARRTYYDFIVDLPYYFYDIFGKFNYLIGRSHYISSFIYLTGDVFDVMAEAKKQGSIKIKHEPLIWGNLIYGLRWLWMPFEKTMVELIGFSTSFVTKSNNQVGIKDNSGDTTITDLVYIDNLNWQRGIKIRFGFGERNGFSFGFDLVRSDFNYRWNINSMTLADLVGAPQEVFFDFAPPDYKNTFSGYLIGGFLNLKFTLLRNINLTPGIRIDKLGGQSRLIYNPFLEINYSHKDLFNIYGIYGKYYQSEVKFGESHQGEVYSAFQIGFLPDDGKFPVSDAFVLGFDISGFKYISSKFEIYRIIRRKIPTISGEIYSEVSDGADIMFRYYDKDVTFMLTYSFGRVIWERYGIRFPGNHDRRHGIKLFGSLNISSRLKILLSWIYDSGFPYTKPYMVVVSDLYLLHTEPVYFYFNSFRSPEYHRLDATLIYTFSRGKFKISPYLTVINLYNRKNKIFLRIDERFEPVYADSFPFIPVIGVYFEL